jgi:alpha-galactosidase
MLRPGIHEDSARRIWALAGAASTYAIGVTPEGYVLQLHWGAVIGDLSDLPDPTLPPGRSSHEPDLHLAAEIFPGWGGLRLGETALKVVFPDGTRDLDLAFVHAEIVLAGPLPQLQIHLRDRIFPLTVTLHFSLDAAHDILIRHATLHNTLDKPVILRQAWSALWHLPRSHAPREMITLAGQWGAETQIQRQRVTPGTHEIGSRHGVTGHGAYPWVAVSDGDGMYFATLAWSGNWQIRVATDITGATRIGMGMSDHDFAWELLPGQDFTTPAAIAGFAHDGLEGARHRLHEHLRGHMLPHPEEPRPVLYNSWEATNFDVSETQQRHLADIAATLGVELFVMDDGWFIGREDDHGGLGDWEPDPIKFPQGLGPLSDHIHELGMQFGLWVEPEMVSPKSKLCRQHPDWIYESVHTSPLSRHQFVLNVGFEPVRAFLFEALDRLITANAIDFLKWDMNRPIANASWPNAPERGPESWVRHVEGVWQIIDGLRARHPQLRIESCAGGGGRADAGMLRRADQIWASDNTMPDARLLIQEGFALALPARVVGAWVTDMPSFDRRHEFPLAFRFHVSMLGALGLGGDLARWSDGELAQARRWVARYKDLRPLIQDGRQFWLASAAGRHDALTAVEFAAHDANRAALFAFRLADPFWHPAPPVRLQGLDAAASYQVTWEDKQPQTFTGAWLMGHGIIPPLPSGLFASTLAEITRIE